MVSLINKFTNKCNCFYPLFKVRGFWNKGRLLGGTVEKRLRTTALHRWTSPALSCAVRPSVLPVKKRDSNKQQFKHLMALFPSLQSCIRTVLHPHQRINILRRGRFFKPVSTGCWRRVQLNQVNLAGGDVATYFRPSLQVDQKKGKTGWKRRRSSLCGLIFLRDEPTKPDNQHPQPHRRQRSELWYRPQQQDPGCWKRRRSPSTTSFGANYLPRLTSAVRCLLRVVVGHYSGRCKAYYWRRQLRFAATSSVLSYTRA